MFCFFLCGVCNMPRKRVNKSPPVDKRSDDGDEDDFFFDDTQSNSGT